MALALGVNIDLEASFSLKPIVDFITGENYVSVTPIPGTLLTGCINVLIG